MKLVTTTGTQNVSARRWTLSGLDSSASFSNGGHVIPLASSPASPQNFATYGDLYKTIPWAYSAVNTLAWAISRLPLKLYRRLPDGTVREVKTAPPGAVGALSLEQELALLLEMPSPGVPMQELLRKMVIDERVFGNCLLTIEEGRTSVPAALHHTPWKKVEARTGEDVPILKYVVRGSKTQKDFRPDQVLHLGRTGDMDGPLGLSPMSSLKYTLALFEALQRHLFKYFSNAARPSGMLKVQPGTAPDKLKLIQKAVEEMYSAPENAGRILVTSAEWQSLASDPASSNIVELLKLSREEILSVFQVPPPVVGVLERSIQANVEGMRSQFLRDVCGPLAAGIEGTLNAQLIWMRPALRQRGLFVAFDMMQALKPDITELASVLEKVRHVLTVQESRDLMGYEPLVGTEMVEKYASTVWFPSGQVPLGLPQPQTKGALEEAKAFPTTPAAPMVPHPAASAEQDVI